MIFALTHNYTGYPMIRQAQAMVAAGELGDIRVVQAEYPQDWLTDRAREDRPEAGGLAHRPEALRRRRLRRRHRHPRLSAWLLLSPASAATELAADLTTFVTGRELDDNGNVMLRFKGGAKGMLWASQVAPGNENGLKLRVYGTKGGLEWKQEDPNYLWYTPFGEPKQLITRGGAGSAPPRPA